MQEFCESHADNSFISCCSVFSKNTKQVIIPTQTCNIIIHNKELFIFYGIRLKINIFVHFNIDKLDRFTQFLIKSYTFVKQQNNTAQESNGNLLDTLMYNLQSYENDYFENSIDDNNTLFTM